jgi:hypothetical protein
MGVSLQAAKLMIIGNEGDGLLEGASNQRRKIGP